MHTVKAVDILDIGTVYQTAITMTTPVLEAGLYMIGFSFQADFHGQKNQPLNTLITGTFGGSEYSDSIGDNDTGFKTRYFGFPKPWAGGAITLGIDCKKASSFSAQCDIDFIDVMVYRVGNVS